MSRPKSSDPRNQRITISVNKGEKYAIKRYASSSKKSVSRYICEHLVSDRSHLQSNFRLHFQSRNEDIVRSSISSFLGCFLRINRLELKNVSETHYVFLEGELHNFDASVQFLLALRENSEVSLMSYTPMMPSEELLVATDQIPNQGSPDQVVDGQPLSTLNLSTRSLRALARAHLNTVEDVKVKTRHQMLSLKGFGKTCLKDVYEKLMTSGFQVDWFND